MQLTTNIQNEKETKKAGCGRGPPSSSLQAECLGIENHTHV
jgi:hypothetical protein